MSRVRTPFSLLRRIYPTPSLTLRLGALMLWIADLLAGLMIAWLYGRTWALRRGLPVTGLLVSLATVSLSALVGDGG